MPLPTPTAPSPITGIQISDVDRTNTQESIRPVRGLDQSTSRTRATRYAVAQGRSADSLRASYGRRSLAHGNSRRTSPKAFSQQIKNDIKTRDGRIGYRRFQALQAPQGANARIPEFHPRRFRVVIVLAASSWSRQTRDQVGTFMSFKFNVRAETQASRQRGNRPIRACMEPKPFARFSVLSQRGCARPPANSVTK
ncbi:hypothetical protein OKW42_003529 [Paraburkholderia sp. WC7.3d]